MAQRHTPGNQSGAALLANWKTQRVRKAKSSLTIKTNLIRLVQEYVLHVQLIAISSKGTKLDLQVWLNSVAIAPLHSVPKSKLTRRLAMPLVINGLFILLVLDL